MSFQNKTNSFLGFLAGLVLTVFGRTGDKINTDDLKRTDFVTSTQRLGVGFGERIRSVFRFRWLRKF